MSSDYEADLDDLRWHWGEAYLIHHLGPDVWVAQRRDSRATIGAEDPETLRERITADYTASPVGRDVHPPAPPDFRPRLAPDL
jgi:hypothetical protein